MDVNLPPLGEGADSGTVVNIFVKEGDTIAKGQPILELENEKAVASIPSTASGRVTTVYVKSGDKVSVGQRLIAVSENAIAEEPLKVASQRPVSKGKAVQSEPAEPEETTETETKLDVPVAASPSVRKLAQDLGIDLTRVRGTAPGGRITMDDLRAYIQRLQKSAAESKTGGAHGVTRPTAAPLDFSKWGKVAKKPLSQLRQVIARRMTESWTTVPHVTQFDEADITDLLALRKKHLAAYEQKGARLTVTSFVLKALAGTLKKHPVFNSSLDEAAQEIVLKEYVHIGIAVDTEAGLVVPVLRDADKKNLVELSKELEELAAKARERKISIEELKGGSFTISNQGGIGGAHFTPIVNKPEVAILGLGRAAAKAVVRENKIEPRTMLPLALSYDHRVIDGAEAARFMVDLVQAIENFNEESVKL
jgi:pyruvate dehydrogenase E2 component (dihydrolipoyllysine-residue acetyltransferase)